MKTCYYELLGVEATATDAELKKAYRRKALLLHPDKNPDDVAGANAKFTLVRAAYEVLLDPQERLWYDAHKGSILREDDDYGAAVAEAEMAIPSISVDELMRHFNPVLYETMNDSVLGFYRVAGAVFERLAAEEVRHGKHQQLPNYGGWRDDGSDAGAVAPELLLYTRFSNSHADYAAAVRPFYAQWSAFATVKTFSWKDEYRYSAAGDRRTRRQMEKENRRLRDAARREYNDTVRRFVAFIKKRDPRVKAGAAALELERRKQEQERLAREARENELRARAAASGYTAQEWEAMDAAEMAEAERVLQEEYGASASLDLEFEEFFDGEDWHECVVCNKVFKTQAQFNVHERSRKHKAEVEVLRAEMLREDADLQAADETDGLESDLEQEGIEEGSDIEGDGSDLEDSKGQEIEVVDLEEVVGLEEGPAHREDVPPPDPEPATLVVDDDVDEDMDELLTAKRKTKTSLEDELAGIVGGVTLDDDWDDKKKRKPRRKPKLDKLQSATPESEPVTPKESAPLLPEQCLSCNQRFPSRNKLFQHMKSTGHAAPVKAKGKRR